MSDVITFQSVGDFKKTTAFLKYLTSKELFSILDDYGERGVELLSSKTPIRTGETAGSWSYEKRISVDGISIEWYNSKLSNDGKTPVVFLIINGHGTRTGGYVPPNDFVTPVMERLFKEATDAVWKAVTSS